MKSTAIEVTLEVPEDLARLLGESSAGLSRAAIEGVELEGLCGSKITVAQVRRLLGFASRHEVDGFLRGHGVLLPLSVENVDRGAETAGRFRAR